MLIKKNTQSSIMSEKDINIKKLETTNLNVK